jgi:hypothetical protein
MGGLVTVQWNAATVVYEGMAQTMLWTRERNRGAYCRNEAAINLLRHHFVQGSGLASSDDEATGNVYFLLNETWKPFSGTVTVDNQSAFAFRKAAQGCFTEWWHATSIEKGWRIFSGNLKELTYAKLALSS